MKRKETDNDGLSLIELIAVIAIVVTLTGLIVPQFTKYITQKRETACVENRDAVVNICEKMVYSGINLDQLPTTVNDIISNPNSSAAVPDEYKNALRDHWRCPEDDGAFAVSVVDGVIVCKCNSVLHQDQDVVADVAIALNTSSGATIDPGFAVPTVPAVTPVVPTPGITPTPGPTPTSNPISNSFFPYRDDSRWDGKRYNGATIRIPAPSGKFGIRNASGATVYYVLIDKNHQGYLDIAYENAYDPSGYLAGRDSECIIATNGTEYNPDSIMEALEKNPSLRQQDNDKNHTINDWQFVISGGTIFYNGDHRYIYFHQGQDQYVKLPTKENVASGGQDGGNKFGNWYLMSDTDETGARAYN